MVTVAQIRQSISDAAATRAEATRARLAVEHDQQLLAAVGAAILSMVEHRVTVHA